MADWVLVGAALAGGFALGALIVALLLRRKAPREEPTLPLEIVAEEFPSSQPMPQRGPPPWRPESARSAPEDSFGVVEDELSPRRRGPPTKRPAPPPPRTPKLPTFTDGIPVEWARRHAGPLEPGRVRGICSGCGTTINVSMRRPIRVACPVCGRTRLLT